MIDILLEMNPSQELLIEIVAWFTTFQSGSNQLLHYTDGVKGCGQFFEERLQTAFFNILQKFATNLSETKDIQVARSLLKGFDCKFLARDFGLLTDKINIFNLFFRGGDSKENLIKDCQSFYIPVKN